MCTYMYACMCACLFAYFFWAKVTIHSLYFKCLMVFQLYDDAIWSVIRCGCYICFFTSIASHIASQAHAASVCVQAWGVTRCSRPPPIRQQRRPVCWWVGCRHKGGWWRMHPRGHHDRVQHRTGIVTFNSVKVGCTALVLGQSGLGPSLAY